VVGFLAYYFCIGNLFNMTANKIQVSGEHYLNMDIQPWDVMASVLTREEYIGFLKGNIVKYSLRSGRKAGSDDIAKARHYMLKLKEVQSETN
jgi:hypothetical protein